MAELNPTLDARFFVGRQATYQISALLHELLRSAHHRDDDDLDILIMAMVPRLVTLNNTAMQALDTTEGAADTEELRRDLVNGHAELLSLKRNL